jgi:hypothetical protein
VTTHRACGASSVVVSTSLIELITLEVFAAKSKMDRVGRVSGLSKCILMHSASADKLNDGQQHDHDRVDG